jgi:hypothetical protein
MDGDGGAHHAEVEDDGIVAATLPSVVLASSTSASASPLPHARLGRPCSSSFCGAGKGVEDGQEKGRVLAPGGGGCDCTGADLVVVVASARSPAPVAARSSPPVAVTNRESTAEMLPW